MFLSGRTDPNARNDQGETALHKAALKGNVKAVEYFIKCSTADVNMKNRYNILETHNLLIILAVLSAKPASVMLCDAVICLHEEGLFNYC